MVIKRDFSIGDKKLNVILLEPEYNKDEPKTFHYLINLLFKLDPEQFTLIDPNRKCVLFDGVLIFLTNDWYYTKRNM